MGGLKINDAELLRTSNNLSAGEPAYAATTLVRAGVGVSGVAWLRCGPQSFTPIDSTGPPARPAMACFPDHRTGELVMVRGDGTLACTPTP